MNKHKILIIEDEIEIRKFLKTAFKVQDYEVIEATTGKEGLQFITVHPPDVIILDLGLPDMDGQEIIKNVREWSHIPIIVLSAKGQESIKVEALEAGADDYLTKPFSTAELIARIKVALRHASKTEAKMDAVQFGDIKIDYAARVVTAKGKEIKLTKIEYKLLSALSQNAGKVVTNTQLLKEVWGKHTDEKNHYLRIYIQRLREKLGDNAENPKYFITEPGVGYRLKA